MSSVVMLGAFGGKSKNMGTTSLLVSENCCIDAGNLLSQLGDETSKINHVFLTHSHLDHILDLPFIIDIFYSHRTESLNVYGLDETIESIKQYVFNGSIWPDFSKIDLLDRSGPSLIFHKIKPSYVYRVNNITFRPFATNHTVPSVGYVIDKDGRKLMFTSDTYCTDNIWEIINNETLISALIIDVSFSSDYDNLAKASMHFTPKLLDMELNKLTRKDITIYINHIKPTMKEKIIKELREFKNTQNCIVLEDGMVVEF